MKTWIQHTVAVLAVALTAVVSLAGCGVTAESTARQLPEPYLPDPQPVNPAGATGAGTVVVRLFLIRDGNLVPVERHVATKPTIDELLRTLLAGPTAAEQDSGIASALLGSDIVTSVGVSKTLATVELAAALNETGRTDEILALAQVVCTLTARAEINGVYFVHDGQRVSVPRADGSLSQGPLTIADYVGLLLA